MIKNSSTPLPSSENTPLPDRTLERDLCNLQVVLSADGIRDIALSSPLWALIMTFIFGGLIPELGERPFAAAWPWIALCAVTGASVFAVWRNVKRRALSMSNGPLQMRMVAMCWFAVGAVWSPVVPIFWEPENTLNHCFLLVLIIGSVSLFLNSKSGKFVVVWAATAPQIGMVWFYFINGGSAFDLMVAIVLPIWTLQLYVDSWRASRTVTEAHRTNLEMELMVTDLAAARDQAARANEAKSTFLANMSHEFRTPLNAIMAFSEVIATDALGRNAQDRYRQYAEDVISSGRHLLCLVNDLLDLAKIESGKLLLSPQWLDGAFLLDECTLILSETARKKNITLQAECLESNLRIYADERALKQIVINLLSNGVKFTPPGGDVRATLSTGDAGITLCVQDNGRGIPADQLARIVQPFEQLDNRYGQANGGTGLGLALVHALTEMHGGKLNIESEVGVGTRVCVWLPSVERTDVPDLGDRQIAA